MNVDKIVKPTALAAPKKSLKYTLANMRSGRLDRPMRIFIYGEEGVGKSQFAFGAPEPMWLGADQGTGHLNIKHRLPQPESYEEILEALRFVQAEPNGAKTLVIDPVGWLQPLVHAKVVADKGWLDIETMADGKSGYGKGINAAVDLWRVIVHELERVSDTGMNVIVIAHSEQKGVKNPEVEDYERYMPQLARGASDLFRQWADYVLFARQKVWTKRGEDKRIRGMSDGARVIETQGMPAFMAKSRPQLPAQLPLSWVAFMAARDAAKNRIAELSKQLDELLAQLGDGEATRNARAYVDADVADIARWEEVVNVITVAIEQQQKGTEST